MRRHYRRLLVVACSLFVFPAAASAAPVRLRINTAGTTAVQGGAPGSDAPQLGFEIDTSLEENDLADVIGAGGAASASASRATQVNRTIRKARGKGRAEEGHGRDQATPELVTSFEGLDFRDQRTANGGNQFSVEPPDQGLCAGNGFVLESVNDVLRVWDTQGRPATGVVDLNSFYGYPAAIDRAAVPLRFGPSITDPSCLFDAETQRWFHVVLTLDRAQPTSQALSGKNHLDLAVSRSASPLGGWIVYRIPVQNDGTDGTPNHGCIDDDGNPGPCLGDYPHIGADANGIYLTTNEFSLFGPGFHGAEIYALSKRALARGDAAVDALLFDSADPDLGIAFDPVEAPFGGFTVWPAQAPGGAFETRDRGTEYFLSSLAVFTDSGVESRLRLWSLTNTRSLDGRDPAPKLSAKLVDVLTYAVPPPSAQKPGDIPLRDCLADSKLQVAPGLFGCWRLVVGAGGPFKNVLGPLDSNDSRMQQVFLADGNLWGALDSAATVAGADRAGIAFFAIDPHSAKVQQQGILAAKGVDLNYPALAVTGRGRGVVAFTAVGPGTFPSAGYAALDARSGAGPIRIAAAGKGPQDGFTEYVPLSAGTLTDIRPRWGDYGAAAVDGDSIWIASEYVAQTCTFAEFVRTNFTCGNTRTILGNWSTRISKLGL
jgi:hypothetical protein